MAPWLSQLPEHPIFTLPDSPTAAAPLSTHPSLSQLSRPASPGLPPIFPDSSLSQSASNRSLFGLSTPTKLQQQQQQQRGQSSNRFSSSLSSSRRAAAQPEVAPVNEGSRKSRMLLVRGVDLVLAVGHELRIASLADVKARCAERGEEEAGYEQEVQLGDYKTLDTPAVNFEIQQLVLNPTSKLLAVIGAHSVAVVVLPRKGWSSAVGRSIECRNLLVGKYYHSVAGSSPVAQALWHPWGASSSSLLVLTLDATVREYSIAQDVEEPSQTLSFAASASSGSSSAGTPRGSGKRFSADDEEAEMAVSMCVGEGKGDWGPLTLYGLMRNGDVLALCPVLPRKAEIPSSYIHALSSFVSSKVDYLSLSSTEEDLNASTTSNSTFRPSTSTLSNGTPSRSNALALTHRSGSGAITSPSERERIPKALNKIYNLQLQYVNALVRQVTATPSPSSSAAGDDADPWTSLTPITAPLHLPGAPALQGPFLLQPGTVDLENFTAEGGEEPRACDIAYVGYGGAASTRGGEGEGESLGVIVTAWNDGKVELMVEVEKVEARWGHKATDEAPSLVVYETLDLGLAAELLNGPSSLPREVVDDVLPLNYPVITRDPLYADTLYVQHAFGAHCIGIGGWLDGLLESLKGGAEGEGEEEEVRRVEREVRRQAGEGEGSEVLWVLKTLPVAGEQRIVGPPVTNLAVVNDIYLGYSLLLATSELQLVGIELSLRVDGGDKPAIASTSSGATADEPAYTSLLSTPFTIPAVLAKPRSAPTALARLAPPKSTTGSKELVINPTTLRYLGSTVEVLQGEIRDLVQGADSVQGRLELQMKELARQLGKVEELAKMSAGAGEGGSDLPARLSAAQKRQLDLLARTDRLLQRLMDAHSPTLSTFEKKWFDELGRLQIEEKKLGDRVERVEGRVTDLEPGLRRLKEREGEARAQKKEQREQGALGETQRKRLEAMLVEEAKLIADARKKVDQLSHALASTSLS